MKGRCSGAMPEPVSRTISRIALPLRSMRSDTAPSLGVNLTALLSRFQTTCCSRSASPTKSTVGSGPGSTASRTPRAAAAGRTTSSAALAIATRSTRRTSSRNLPLMMRETSSTSSIRRAWASALRSIVASPRSKSSRVARAAPQDRGPAQDCVQRRAQLVAHRGQELVLQAIGRLCVAGERAALRLGVGRSCGAPRLVRVTS